MNLFWYSIFGLQLVGNNMIETQLKIIEEKEFKDFFQLIDRNKKRLKRYFPLTVQKNESIESTIEYLKEIAEKTDNRETYVFGIYTQEKLIGVIYIKEIDWRIPKCELGYFIDKKFEGKGLMSKVIEETTKYCFERLKIEKIFLKIGSENIGSKRLAIKNGFLLEGILRNEFRIETNELINVEYYGKLNPITYNF